LDRSKFKVTRDISLTISVTTLAYSKQLKCTYSLTYVDLRRKTQESGTWSGLGTTNLQQIESEFNPNDL